MAKSSIDTKLRYDSHSAVELISINRSAASPFGMTIDADQAGQEQLRISFVGRDLGA